MKSLLYITFTFNALYFASISNAQNITGIINYLENVEWVAANQVAHNNLVKKQTPKRCYDFIVVGAGTAGCVVASRLSENRRVSVLLVEAGGPENVITDTPALYPFLAKSPDKDWAFVTEPQTNAFLNAVEQRAYWQRGKSMGGSHAVNGMVYLRGNRHDFDNWENLGNYGWSYDEVLPYFKLSERNTNPTFVANGYHGDRGPLPVTSNADKNDSNPYPHKTVDGYNELGFNTIDLNGQFSVGTNTAQQNILNGTRVTTCKAFLEPVYDSRPNLDVLAYSYVTKVLFSANKKAIGIQFQRLNKSYTVRANKEVILSAGAIKSPQLLLLSGVGPIDQLNNFSIPLVHNLRGVGENLHDHAYCIGLAFTAPQTDAPTLSVQNLIEYGASKSGPLAHLDTPICTPNSSVNNATQWPDIQITGLYPPNSEPTGVLANNIFGLRFDVFAQMYLPYVNASKSPFLLTNAVSRPKSRGKLQLKSRNPFTDPIMQPNYLSNPYDLQVLVDGLKWIYRVSKTSSISNFAQPLPSLVSGCESLYAEEYDVIFPTIKIPVYEYLRCHATHMTIAGLHMVGTCKMGPKNDRLAVVDPRLRVYGVNRLRVMDASIMPVITDANTNAATIMIGERGSQFIKQYYNL